MKHVVGFSGGIDSQACARWVLNRYPKEDVILLNSDAGGNEHPITTEFIYWYSENVHPVTVVQPIVADMGRCGTKSGQAKDRRDELRDADVMDFATMAYIKGTFPSSQAQFCTTHLKLFPQNRWMKENLISRGIEYQRYSGVRREEGEKNKSWRASAVIEGWDDFFACPLIQPIADWTKRMCFDYVQAHGEKVNELYTLGFDRVGCAPCINPKKSDILQWATRFPEMIDKVRDWEKRVGRTFYRPIVPGMEINWIDDVVAWSKTTHGGKQLNLLVLQEPPACESNYGLCE